MMNDDERNRRHMQRSIIQNARERICILIDEEEVDEAKEEVNALCDAILKWIGE
jgi:hypothetical protein